MATEFIATGDWFSWNNDGAGLAVADVSGSARPDLVVFQVDAPDGANQGYYRIGWDVDAAGQVTGGWSPWISVPDWFSWENQGADIAIADLNGNGRPDLVVFQIDSPAGQNQGYYRVGWNLDGDGKVTGGWGPWEPVPDWFSWENQGAGIALGDLRGNGQTDLIVFHIDAPPGVNLGYYRVGWDVGADGKVKGGWSAWMPLPGWFSWENQDGAIALADIDGDGRSELVVFQVDAPPENNKAYYCVGWDIDGNGKVGGWSPWVEMADWFSWENQGAGLALASLDGAARGQLILLQVDSPPQQNQGYYRALDLKLDLDRAASDGVWRLLPDITQVLPIHGGLLHTGKILFFAGSSNNPNRAGGDFRSTIWDHGNGTFAFPPTPIDFFCAGHAFLPDGRMLVAGGTKEYDFGHPFFGLRDAFVFDPADEQWQRVGSMAGGRWYPTLVTLGDGRVLAMSGLAEHGEEPFPDLEVYADPSGWTTLPAALSDRWPLYAHMHLMADGRVFYSGAQFGPVTT